MRTGTRKRPKKGASTAPYFKLIDLLLDGPKTTTEIVDVLQVKASTVSYMVKAINYGGLVRIVSMTGAGGGYFLDQNHWQKQADRVAAQQAMLAEAAEDDSKTREQLRADQQAALRRRVAKVTQASS